MKATKLKFALIATLVAASAPAFASTPTIPDPWIVPAGPTPAATTGNGGLFVSVWDDIRGVSLVTYLGLRMDDFLPGGTNATPDAGLSLNFGLLPSWSSTFGGSDPANIQYQISAFDSTVVSGNSTVGKRLLTTATDLVNTGVVNGSLVSANQQGNSFIASGLNGATNCNGVNPCQALSSSAGSYAGQAGFGSQYGGYLAENASTAVGSSLNFYYVTATTNGAFDSATVTQFQNSAADAAKWLLGSDGTLSFTSAATSAAVPLPAAVWLLLSGIAGFGAVGRRRPGNQA